MFFEILKNIGHIGKFQNFPKYPDFSEQLLSCIGTRSWLLFDLIQVRDEKLYWMRSALIYWDKMIGFQNIEKRILSMEVLNDCAEGSELVTDFKDMSKDANE